MTIKQTASREEEKGVNLGGPSLFTAVQHYRCEHMLGAIGLIRSTVSTDSSRPRRNERVMHYMKICHLSVNRKAIKNSHKTGCGNIRSSNRNFFNTRVALDSLWHVCSMYPVMVVSFGKPA